MAVDMFLELDKINGETNDKVYGPKKAIDILAWSWGMSQSGSFHVGGGGGAGKANFQDLSVTKYVDNSTPTLMQKLATGDHVATGVLTIRKAGKVPLEYIKLKLTKIMVTSLSTGGSGGEDRLTENLTLNFAEFEVIYTPQKADGSGGTAVPFKFDIAKNDAEA
jgi:type VI secretion system secreted protein Hcp